MTPAPRREPGAPPREESAILVEREEVTEKLAAIEQRGRALDAVRSRLEALLADVERSVADSAITYTAPAWASHLPVVTMSGPRRAAEEVRLALRQLDAIESGATVWALSPLLHAAADDPAVLERGTRLDRRTGDRPSRLEELRAELAALDQELERRKAGPGPKRVYKLVKGHIGMMGSDGQVRVLSPPALIEFDDWQAGCHLYQVEPVEDATAS